jgi:hypothetical protein
VTTPTAVELLERPDALLNSSHLRQLGLERRAVEAVFRACPNVLIPGYSRPLIRVSDYLRHLDGWTYRDDRPYPC